MRLRTAWLLTTLLAAALAAHAAKPPKVQWADTLSGLGGAYGSCVIQTADGGYVAVGSTGVDSIGAPDNFYYFVARIGPAGHTLWTTTIARESVGHEDGTPRGVSQTRDGGFIVLGTEKGADYCQHPHIVKIDSAGARLWESVIDGDSFAYVTATQKAADDGYVLAGPLERTGLFLMKVDSAGTRVWCRPLPDEATRHRYKYDMREGWPPSIPLASASDGGFVTASRNDKVGLILWKIDSIGTEVWRQTYCSDSIAGARTIASTADGGFVIAGYAGVWEPSKPWRVYLMKVDSVGTKQWRRSFGRGIRTRCNSVSQTTDSGFVVTGTVESAKYKSPRGDVFVLRTDRNGNELWYTVISPSTAEAGGGSCVQQTSDGGYVLCGTLGWRIGSGFRARLFVAKLAPDRRR